MDLRSSAEADPSLEEQDPDEARPIKRARLDAPLNVTEDIQDEVVDDGDGWDDIYGDTQAATDPQLATLANGANSEAVSTSETSAPSLIADASTAAGGAQPALEVADDYEQALPSAGSSAPNGAQEAASKDVPEDGVPPEAIDHGDELVSEQRNVSAVEEASERMVEETTDLNQDSKAEIEAAGGQFAENAHLPELTTTAENDRMPVDDVMAVDAEAQTQPTRDDGASAQAGLKPIEDAEFMGAAAAQKDKAGAEWQFDASDAESSSTSDSDSDDSSSGDSDSDSDGGYEMLDAATAAKILMSGEGDDDDEGRGKNKGGADHQPRTANEVKEDVVPKPDVVVTEDMKITELGVVERTVENMALIKGSTPGEYQVLESGSVLCNDKREVIGAIADTFGKVQQPMYSVAFTNEAEIEKAGLAYGVKVFYVDQHSTFVFTQPLKNLKGTDASNIHDEEIAEDEMEFSDDEAEAEYKRQKKLAKKAGRGGMGAQLEGRGGSRAFGAPGHNSGQTYVNGSDAPQQTYGGGMSYDDEPAEEFYSPLKRPDNLSEMMSRGGSAPTPQHGNKFDRGRGRGHGDRRRGDRGRGRGDRGRGGRGGFTADRGQRGGGGGRGGFASANTHRGNAQSFPDRHNSERVNGDERQHSLPSKPRAPQGSSPPPQQYPPMTNQYQQPPQQQSYQFNGYTFQYGNPPPPPPPQQQAYYSHQQQAPPAFFPGQQHQQQPQQAPSYPSAPYSQQGFAGWGGQQPQQQPSPYAQPGVGAPAAGYAGSAQQQQQQQQQSNLADILRNLSGQR